MVIKFFKYFILISCIFTCLHSCVTKTSIYVKNGTKKKLSIITYTHDSISGFLKMNEFDFLYLENIKHFIGIIYGTDFTNYKNNGSISMPEYILIKSDLDSVFYTRKELSEELEKVWNETYKKKEPVIWVITDDIFQKKE